MAAPELGGATPQPAVEAAAIAGAPEIPCGGVRFLDPMLAVGVLSAGPKGPLARRLASEEQPARRAATAPVAVSRNALSSRSFRFVSTITQKPAIDAFTTFNKRQMELRERLR